MKSTKFFLINLIFLLLAVNAFSQNINYEGGFSIDLPNNSRNGYSGNGTAGGIEASYRVAEIAYKIGYYEKQGLPMAFVDGEPDSELIVKHYFNQFSARGERIYAKDISLQDFKGREYKYKTDKSVFLLRLFNVDTKGRIYELVAEIPLSKQTLEDTALKAFDSFKLLSDEVVTKELDRRIAEATPSALPQNPVVPKAKSDAQDRNLKGKIKSVLTETAHYSLKNSLRQKHPQSVEEFDEKGNLLKTTEYDYLGFPWKIYVYGYVAGKRVAKIGSIENENSIGGIAFNFPSNSKFDERFQESYGHKYLGGNLVEESKSFSNGALFWRAKYSYLKNKRTSLYFDGGTKPFSKVETVYDEKGNEVKMTVFEPERQKMILKETFKVVYASFDENGNWTQREIMRDYSFEGQEKYFPEYVEYRTIKYF
ncbi:MAG TPA: hypothetical protein PKY59_21035 [Pyrinomonadaceae bacterium]|nr:hypothetical protein [Pyrinomonadaceae bacterium]